MSHKEKIVLLEDFIIIYKKVIRCTNVELDDLNLVMVK